MSKWFSSVASIPPSPAVAMTRGLNPRAALDFVRSRGGAAAIAQVLTALPREDRHVLAGDTPLKERSWVPFATQGRLLKTIDEVLGTGDMTLLFHVGEHMAHRDIPRMFRPMLKLGTPGWVVEFGLRMWRYYHNAGRWEIARTPVTVLATLHDHPSHDAFCATLVGWLTGALSLGGGVAVMVDHPVCHARGAPNCVFTARWNRKRKRGDSTEPIDRFMVKSVRGDRTETDSGSNPLTSSLLIPTLLSARRHAVEGFIPSGA